MAAESETSWERARSWAFMNWGSGGRVRVTEMARMASSIWRLRVSSWEMWISELRVMVWGCWVWRWRWTFYGSGGESVSRIHVLLLCTLYLSPRDVRCDGKHTALTMRVPTRVTVPLTSSLRRVLSTRVVPGNTGASSA